MSAINEIIQLRNTLERAIDLLEFGADIVESGDMTEYEDWIESASKFIMEYRDDEEEE